MKKLKLALIGTGFLNEILAEAMDEHLPEYELVGVLGRSEEKTKAFAEKYSCIACSNIDELLDLNADYISEAASVEAVREYGESVLKSGANFVVLSIGAFADGEFYEHLKNVAREENKKIYIPSGAVGGFDVLRTAALMSPITASISSQKSAGALKRTPLYTDELLDVKGHKRVFSGTTAEAIKILPTQVNVAVATALASAGPENTIMNIDVVEGFAGDEYKIEIKGEEIRTELNIYSRTSKIAAWSVVAVLKNIVSPVVF